MPTTQQLTKLRVPDLKELLRSHGLRVTGKKADLVSRLEAFYQEQQGGGHASPASPAQPAPLVFDSDEGAGLSDSSDEDSETSEVFRTPDVTPRRTPRSDSSSWMCGLASSSQPAEELNTRLIQSAEQFRRQYQAHQSVLAPVYDVAVWSEFLRKQMSDRARVKEITNLLRLQGDNITGYEASVQRACHLLQQMSSAHVPDGADQIDLQRALLDCLQKVTDIETMRDLLRTIRHLKSKQFKQPKPPVAPHVLDRMLVEGSLHVDVLEPLLSARYKFPFPTDQYDPDRIVDTYMSLSEANQANTRVLSTTLFCLGCYLGTSTEAAQKAVDRPFFLQQLSYYLSHSSIQVVNGALRVVGNLAYLPETMPLIEMGLLDQIMSILRRYSVQEGALIFTMWEESFWSISNIIGTSQLIVSLCLKRGLISLILTYYSQFNGKVKEEIAWLLSNIFSTGVEKSCLLYLDEPRLYTEVVYDLLNATGVNEETLTKLKKQLMQLHKEVLPSLTCADDPDVVTIFEEALQMEA